MMLKLETVKQVFMVWILLEINYVAWLENGKPWLKPIVTVNLLMDTLLEFSLLLLQEETNLKRKKPVMPNILRLKKSEKKLSIYWPKKLLNALLMSSLRT